MQTLPSWADENTWPSYFTLAVEYQLASIFAAAIARDDGLMKMMDDKARLFMSQAHSRLTTTNYAQADYEQV